MPKATLTLGSGTIVTIEGTAEEVNRLLELHEMQLRSPLSHLSIVLTTATLFVPSPAVATHLLVERPDSSCPDCAAPP